MAALPGSEWTDEPQPLPAPSLGRIRHVFTHFALELDRGPARSSPTATAGGIRSTASMRPGLPTLYRRAAELALARPDERASGLTGA